MPGKFWARIILQSAYQMYCETKARRERVAPIVTFLARYWLARVLLQISSGATWLARKAVPRA